MYLPANSFFIICRVSQVWITNCFLPSSSFFTARLVSESLASLSLLLPSYLDVSVAVVVRGGCRPGTVRYFFFIFILFFLLFLSMLLFHFTNQDSFSKHLSDNFSFLIRILGHFIEFGVFHYCCWFFIASLVIFCMMRYRLFKKINNGNNTVLAGCWVTMCSCTVGPTQI